MNELVYLTEIEPEIVQITMEDRVYKNTYTHEFMVGLVGAFEKIKQNKKYKVVILTGYDTYFASGGSKDGLLAIHEGKTKFNDINFYSVALDCEIPVIAAMQGHGIGGGFVMGMFADFVVLGRENVYTTNFMKYGFTPGMGATYIITKKLGIPLGHDMLLNAQNFRGADLEKRGFPFPVYPRNQVLEKSLELAQQLAEKPRVSLVILKKHLVEEIKKDLPAVIEKELVMHSKTIHEDEVKERINSLFGN
ncbi:MAG: enoyl-CoA hydratase/isomerase family protein [Flavobacteriales bacterium]|nr:enoyl-CoA hydratase/isomerase family protein [Flavobacteriales bacterium]